MKVNLQNHASFKGKLKFAHNEIDTNGITRVEAGKSEDGKQTIYIFKSKDNFHEKKYEVPGASIAEITPALLLASKGICVKLSNYELNFKTTTIPPHV